MAHHLTVPSLSHTPSTAVLFTARSRHTGLNQMERPSVICAHYRSVFGLQLSRRKLEASDEPVSPQLQGNPHSTTNISPSESLNNRKIKTMLPEMPSTSKPEQKAMAECDARKKEQMRSCADNRRGAKESCIKPGDTTVLLKQPKNLK
jgi:hypothetical protein